MRYHLFQKFFRKMVKIKETSFLSPKKSSFSASHCITTCNIFRIKSKTPPPTAPQTEVHEPVKISFLTSFERKMFMKNLKNLRTYQNLKISMDCPQMLLPEYRIADKKAYDLRAQAPGTKTILTIKDQKVIILAKGPEQDTYKEWKEPVTEAETTEI